MRLCWRGFSLLAFITLLTNAWSAPVQTYRVARTYPHDPQAFTQGLLFADGHLYESTGENGKSTLRMVNLETGRVEQEVPVASQYFAEGLSTWGSTLIQLTWQSHTAFVYDRFSFRQLRSMSYPWEGWGLTTDGHLLVLSDGTATLHFVDPETMKERRRVEVKDHGQPVTYLNATGKVLGWIDLSGLLPPELKSSPEAVLNGIAYDAARDRLFVTGKLWPKLFEIQVIPQRGR